MLSRPAVPFVACLVAVCVPAAVAAAAEEAAVPAPAAPAAADELAAGDVYRACLHWLARGKQRETERVLAEAVRAFTGDARLLFFAAACERSRFDVEAARPMFERVVKADAAGADGVYGRAAGLILDLDAGRDVGANFDALRAHVNEHWQEPLLLWMAGVQGRAQQRPIDGAWYYERLFERLDGPGPALVHQTYANLLDDCGRSADAWLHREMAVWLEPAPWSYDGMGNTATRLKRWEDADAAYAKSTSAAPHHDNYWVNWSWSFLERGDAGGAAEKCRRGTALHPRSVTLWNNWGDAERKLGRPRDALARYERALELRPASVRALRGAAAVLRELGESDRAAEMESRLAAPAAGG